MVQGVPHYQKPYNNQPALVIGNGESRGIYPIQTLKNQGHIIYGCNAIYRDYPTLCDYIVAVNMPMYNELMEWYKKTKPNLTIIGPNDISKWNYLLPGEEKNTSTPIGLKLYRQWAGGDFRKKDRIKTIDFSESKGTGCSAVLHAAEHGHKDILILAFDIMGARQWENKDDASSRIQNNMYKDTINYPQRVSMKAYLKYEWMFQLRQIFIRFPHTNFYFINRVEYLRFNPYLRYYFNLPNIKCGIYADLKRWMTGHRNKIQFINYCKIDWKPKPITIQKRSRY